MRRDLPRISEPVAGLQYILPLVIVFSLGLLFVGWLMLK